MQIENIKISSAPLCLSGESALLTTSSIMNRQITAFLAVIFAFLFSFAAIPEARDMDKNQALSAIQQSIIPIAAFTANGDMKKLNTGLTEAQMRNLISVLEVKVGKKEADNAYEILGKVLSTKGGQK